MKVKIISTLCFILFIINGAYSQEQKVSPFERSSNYGKSVAVFGGSVSVIPESKAAKSQWTKNLKMLVTDYGVSGAGFSSLQGKSMQQQIDSAGVHDIYIFWASTNDYTNQRPVGAYTDYTEFDDYDDQKLVTQAGGINYCIQKVYEINPKAKLYFFTSSKAFNDRGGYDASDINGMKTYVEIQKEICRLHGIPFLDQFTLGGFNIFNKDIYYRDAIHMNELGYEKLGELQVAFLAFQ